MDVNFSGHVTRRVPVEETTQVGQARREATALAEVCGFDETDVGRVALAATELATNMLKHGRGGLMHLSLVQGRHAQGVELCAVDRGPGFSLAQCLPDGYSTGGTQGLGLGAIQRQAAALDVWSDERGAIVLARIHAENAPRDADLAYGALRLPTRHEVACGDAWHLAFDGQRLAATLIDGLGHGVPATEAANAGAAAAAQAGPLAPADLLARLHGAMSGTRGGAAAVACLDVQSGMLRFSGIGNIAASVCDLNGARGLASHPGIVGVQYRKAQTFDLHVQPGNLLVMHSDGLQARWSLRDYPGLIQRHPALVAAVLQRDFDRGRDDAGILVVRLGAL
ncbi:ATP-binding protein [Stenotrophomonas sp. HITSZ_GD]|uniref:ATP-binding protein n=1 Tax=Stenotrophomonas sp. HITSZ_GD TaxID=3037248 RepID=UPI00240DF781|nr:ATP-binding protein [Stenotrophomonas sp. HITSZ_GD]MDG2526033.1 ATP-binding protein [Stenotrophomonas sp. HITSZ_GD]